MDRQTERQTDGWTDGQDTHVDQKKTGRTRHTCRSKEDRHTEKEMEIEIDNDTEIETEIEINIETERSQWALDDVLNN